MYRQLYGRGIGNIFTFCEFRILLFVLLDSFGVLEYFKNTSRQIIKHVEACNAPETSNRQEQMKAGTTDKHTFIYIYI